MGSIKSKLQFPYYDEKQKYKEAYLLLGDNIFKNPIKYIIKELNDEYNWETENIIDMLLYLRDYTFVIEKDMERVREIEVWIGNLEDKIMIKYNKDALHQIYADLYV